MLRLLKDELCVSKKGQDKLDWLAAMDAAFAGAKQALLSATHLAHPTVGTEPWVVVDPLATHVGACLPQQLPGKKDCQPLGFFSKKLKAAQQKYAYCDRELSPATPTSDTSGICRMVAGSTFSRTTSPSPMPWHRCPIHGLHTSPGSYPMWQSTYTSDIRHIARAANIVADTLQAARSCGGG
jgi:hypothetical protein